MANFNFNQAIIGGRLTDHPELKKTNSDNSVVSFSVAVNHLDKEKNQVTDFIDVTAWGKTAEFVCRYFKKGSSICVIGRLQKRKFTDKNGIDRYVTEIIAQEVKFVDAKADNENPDFLPVPEQPQAAESFTAYSDDDDLPF